MRLLRNSQIVPVLMFHSVGPQRPNWLFSHLADSVACFEGTLKGLSDAGFRTLTLEELYRHMSAREKIPGHAVVLTFDDGYLDNWVYAVPLLRKYGMRATVYVTPEFVDESDTVRPVHEDLATARRESADEAPSGFMNWAELNAAQSEGVLDIQSHSLTHTWYFSGPRCLDFHRPRRPDPYPWLAWNARPARKPFYMAEDQQSFVPWGHPVFEHEKSLVARKFEPEPGPVNEITEWVADNGGAEFFGQPQWRADLESRFGFLRGAGSIPGRRESDEAYRERVFAELSVSRTILEERLDKHVRYVAWPGGGNSGAVVEAAKKAGYLSWTLSSRQEPEKRNIPGSDPSGIKRISGSGNSQWQGRQVGFDESWWVVRRTLSHQGDAWSRTRIRLRKLIRFGQSLLRERFANKDVDAGGGTNV